MKNKKILHCILTILSLLFFTGRAYGTFILSPSDGYSSYVSCPGHRCYVYKDAAVVKVGNNSLTDTERAFYFIPQGMLLRIYRVQVDGSLIGYDWHKWMSNSYLTEYLHCEIEPDGAAGNNLSLKGGEDDVTKGHNYRCLWARTTAQPDPRADAYISRLGRIRSLIATRVGYPLDSWSAWIENDIYYMVYGFRVNYCANGSTYHQTGLKWRYYSTVPFDAPTTNPSRAGCIFNGWAETSGEVVSLTASGAWTHNLTNTDFMWLTGNDYDCWESRDKTFNLYAQWIPIAYTIHFDNNGGEGDTTNQVYYVSDASSALRTPTRPGHTFNGWKVVSGSTEGWASSINSSSYITAINTGSYGDLYLQAQWTTNSYSISFDGNCSTSGFMPSVIAQLDQDYTLPANTFERKYIVSYDTHGGTCDRNSEDCPYQFAGWEDHGSVTYNGTTYTCTQFDAPYYANSYYSDIYPAYKYDKYLLLRHYVNWGKGEGRTCVGSTPATYPDQATVKNLAFNNNISTPFDSNVTVPLVAQWNPQSVTLPTPTRPGYLFFGWYTDAIRGIKVGDDGASYTPTADVTLHAHWVPIKYTANFEMNGGVAADGTPSSVEFNVEQSLTMPAEPYKMRYTFSGWQPSASGNWSSSDLYPAETVIPAGKYGNVTFTAQYNELSKGNLTVSASGLANNDIAVCTIVSSVDGTTYVVNLTSSHNSVTLKNVYIGSYTITSKGWQFNYTLNGTAEKNATVTEGGNQVVTFEFQEKTGAPKHDSNFVVNILK